MLRETKAVCATAVHEFYTLTRWRALRCCSGLAQELAITATSDLFARVEATPAVQSLARRLEDGGVLSCSAIAQAAQPFFAALLHHLFPERQIVVVTEGLKTQEGFQQDLTTWLSYHEPQRAGDRQLPSTNLQSPLFYPSWEILPHEDRLPHVDVISERLETLTALISRARPTKNHAMRITHRVPVVVTNVVALLQRTFPCDDLQNRARNVNRGDRVDPLDLVEWLEEQGYEPEAQVTQKGEISLRGGILDLFPPTSPWPVRLEFFGDELESLRHFDPLTQMSREEITSLTIPPAGELGLLKRRGARSAEGGVDSQTEAILKKCGVGGEESGVSSKTEAIPATQAGRELGTLIDYLSPESIFVFCEPERLEERATEYAAQVPAKDRFFIAWDEFQEKAATAGMTLLKVTEFQSEIGAELVRQESVEETEAPVDIAQP